jgi:hypothetical protein
MSATRDKNQKTTFVYSNLYQLYKKGKEAAVQAEVPAAPASSQVLKVENLNEPTFAATKVKISSYQPTEFIQKRIEKKPAVLKVAEQANQFVRPFSVSEAPAVDQNPVIESLKNNLKSLNDLHSRLKFMLQELEDLVKE